MRITLPDGYRRDERTYVGLTPHEKEIITQAVILSPGTTMSRFMADASLAAAKQIIEQHRKKIT